MHDLVEDLSAYVILQYVQNQPNEVGVGDVFLYQDTFFRVWNIVRVVDHKYPRAIVFTWNTKLDPFYIKYISRLFYPEASLSSMNLAPSPSPLSASLSVQEW